MPLVCEAAPATALAGKLIVDLFAGAGGASSGIETALGRSPDNAVNHDAHAIRCHEANHPTTRHYCESVHDVDPLKACGGRPVGLLWLSPDCRHFSRAKGAAPVSPSVRALAWVGVTWAEAVRPEVIILENVGEFQTWGPLDDAGAPIRDRAGETFHAFVARLRGLGYIVDWRMLTASDFGAPTSRCRLFLVARCDGQPVAWPEPTHGIGRLPVRTAAECIDWSLPCPSIFGRKRELANATKRRVAAGVVRYVLRGEPYLVQCAHGDFGTRAGARCSSLHAPLGTITGSPDRALVAPSLIPMNGEDGHRQPRASSIEQPLGTVMAGAARHALVSAFLAKHFTGAIGSDLRQPMGTVTATDHHSLIAAHLTTLRGSSTTHLHGDPIDRPLRTVSAHGSHHALCAALLVHYYGSGPQAQDLREPMRTIVSRARHGLVIVPINGSDYVLDDIGLRMLQPHELARAQGFSDSYIIAGTKAQRIARVGNSVCPPVAAAVVAAQFPNCRPGRDAA